MNPFQLSTWALAAIVGSGLLYGTLRVSPESRLERAVELAYQGRLHDAASEYQALLVQIGADEGEAAARLRRRALLRLGDLRYLELGDERGGVESYRELVDAAPGTAEAYDAHEKLAVIAKRRGDLAEAISHWQALAQFGGEGDERYRYEIAKAYLQLHSHEQARQEAHDLYVAHPSSPWAEQALFLIGSSLQLEGKHEGAVAAFEAVDALYPGTELAARARLQVGQSHSALRNWEAALSSLLAALETHPDPWRVQAEITRVRKHLAEHRKIMGNLHARLR